MTPKQLADLIADPETAPIAADWFEENSMPAMSAMIRGITRRGELLATADDIESGTGFAIPYRAAREWREYLGKRQIRSEA